ncbi:hypothetical protein LPJ66_002053, partial [Kickxella alabastrina]
YRRYGRFLQCVRDEQQASDLLAVLAAYEDWRRLASSMPGGGAPRTRELVAFCKANWLSREALEQIEDFREQYLRLLCDRGLVSIPAVAGAGRAGPGGGGSGSGSGSGSSRSLARLIRPQVPTASAVGSEGGGSRFRPGFVQVPPAFDVGSGSVNVIYAAIVTALDHVLLPSVHDPRAFVIGQASIAERPAAAAAGIGHERVSARPIALSTQSHLHSGLRLSSSHALIAASLSGTSTATYANTLTKVNLSTVAVFARSLEYWPGARLLIVDQWIGAKCAARTAVVLMMIRNAMRSVMEFKVRFPLVQMPEHLNRWQQAIVEVLKNENV